MKRLVLLFAALFVFMAPSVAQDIITKKDGTAIKAKVMEVGVSGIRYLDIDKQVDVIYALPKSEVYSITYENGQKELLWDNNGNTVESLLDGQMTYNSWRGDVSINEIRVDASRYLSPMDYDRYKSGRTLGTIGSIMIGGGVGGALGWLIGSGISGGGSDEDGVVYGICAGLVILGLPLDLVGSSMIKKSVRSFNSANGFAERNLEVNVGVQNYGFGLALKF